MIRLFKSKDKDDLPPVGKVSWGDMRRVTPFCKDFGFSRGAPIDRYYIERFLETHANDIKGKVLEVRDNSYTLRFGASRVTHSDVLDIDPKNKKATVIADLTRADQIPDDSYDCIILTQVLQFIYDFKSVIQTVHRILKPQGVFLITVPGISQIDYSDPESAWYWSFSDVSMRRILNEFFPLESISIEKYGNVLTTAAMLYGMSSAELTEKEFSYDDRDYQLVITAKSVKPIK